jgi:hypothetical protein
VVVQLEPTVRSRRRSVGIGEVAPSIGVFTTVGVWYSDGDSPTADRWSQLLAIAEGSTDSAKPAWDGVGLPEEISKDLRRWTTGAAEADPTPGAGLRGPVT